MTPHPPFADDWAGLAAVAERLCADRAAGDPRQLEAGRLTQAQAEDRARVSGALAAQWRAIADRRPIPWLDASSAEILADLERAAEATARHAARSPDATIQLGTAPIPYTRFAEAVAALHWHQQPYRAGTDTPRIAFVHGLNLMIRAERTEREAA